MKIVFLLEEQSMKEALKGFLPRVVPRSIHCIYVVHEGKQDLEKSIPRKLRAWREDDVRFIVLRDQDQADCQVVKTNLTRLCEEGGRSDVLVRVVCRELESWFLGDLKAVEAGMGIGNLSGRQNQAKFRSPDSINQPAEEIKRIVVNYQKISGARAIGKHMNPSINKSRSFRVFISGLVRIIPEEINNEIAKAEPTSAEEHEQKTFNFNVIEE